MATTYRDIVSYAGAVRTSVNLAINEARKVLAVAMTQARSPSDVADAMEAALQAIAMKYGRVASAAAVEYYRKMQEGSGSEYIPAIADEDLPAISASARWAMSPIFDGDIDEAVKRLGEAVETHVKGHATRTMVENGINDPWSVKFARVPTGATTCNFCVTLASRGFVYASRDAAGQFSKFHPDCDCQVVSEYGDGVQGYDEGLYLEAYVAQRSPNSPKATERGRAYNEANREARNARRRELYARKREEEGKDYKPRAR